MATVKEISDNIKGQLSKTVLNQEQMTELALTALFAGGHVLLEGVPGLAKTLWVRALARVIDGDFKRVQFTSDLMPSDILGGKVYSLKTGEFELKKGPLFTQLFLADEINRTPPKTQSALLEVMEERAITIDGETHALAEPFFVMATQNPIEYEGTYPLPEALTDRFMMKLLVTYPGVAAEKQMLQLYNSGFESVNLANAGLEPVCHASDIVNAAGEIKNVRVEDGIINYIVSIVETTRRVGAVMYGASPRATVSLLLAAKAYAAMQGRDFVIPDDVRFLSVPVLRHRIILKPEAEIDGMKTDEVVEHILSQAKVPR
ncbi:MAG: MoxR family ATPase [Clostridiales bacterium]|jgi:MoxR-like ATPase|nr:MoxR family ATPase [Clostridiales bacterium]